MCDKRDRYEIGNRPSEIDAPPRNSEFGTVVDEVGVYEKGPGKDYWKVIQRIEDGSDRIVRIGYYAGKDEEWSWSSRPMMILPEVFNELYARAVSNGILEK
jgi:hypothetical protein